jgi:ABC transporter with metal-binding/Fe-S-binding domain ATP-binding protein
MTGVQAEVMGIPLVQVTTEGEKEEELQDLERAIIEAHNTYGIEGVVTGAVESVYQATRIQKICHDVGVWCFNPLWLKDQVVLLQEIIENHFKVIITGIFAYPLDEGWLGKEIDTKILERLIDLKNKYRISPSGEGGEIETTVLDAPFFKKIIKVTDYEIKANKNSGVYIIKNVDLVEK